MGKFKGKTAIILTTICGDWQGLYIDGSLYDEEHRIGSGEPTYLLKLAEDYDFTSLDVAEHYLSEIDDNSITEKGSFPTRIEKLNDYLEYIK